MVPNRIPLPGLCLGLGPASWLAQLNCSSFLSDPGEPPDSSAGCPQPSTTFLPAVAAFKLKLLHSAWPVLLPHLHSSRAWQWAPAHRMSSGQAWKWLAGCIEPRYQTWCSPLLATDVAESSWAFLIPVFSPQACWWTGQGAHWPSCLTWLGLLSCLSPALSHSQPCHALTRAFTQQDFFPPAKLCTI